MSRTLNTLKLGAAAILTSVALLASPVFAAEEKAATPNEMARFLAGLPAADGTPMAAYNKHPSWAGHARAILTAPDPRGLAQRAISEGLNVREVERIAQQAKDEKHGPRAGAASADAKSADTRALEQSLSNALGLEVTITDKNGAGDVKVSYKTLEQLDEVIRRLRGGF